MSRRGEGRAGSVAACAGQAHQQPTPAQFALKLPLRGRGSVRLPCPAQMAEQGQAPKHKREAHQQLEGEVEHLPLTAQTTLGLDSRAGVASCWERRPVARHGP